MGQFLILSHLTTIYVMVHLRHLAVVFVLGVVTVHAAERFCPRERRDGLECRAKEKQFKCGIFFENLLGDGNIKWIGALPDAIKKTRRTNPDLVTKIFPKVDGQSVKESYFTEWSNECDENEAKTDCYLLMSQIANKKLDSCERTVGNLDGKNTIGNELCSQARRFMVSADKDISQGLTNQAMSFYSSTCLGKWKPVTSDTDGQLLVEQRLCCNSSWKYYSCDGSTITESC